MIRYIHPAAWSCIILHPPSTNKSACTHCYFGAVGPPSSVGSPIQAHRSTSFPGYRPPSHTQDFHANQCINWIKYLAKEPYHASLTLLQLHSHLWMKGHLTRKELLSHTWGAAKVRRAFCLRQATAVNMNKSGSHRTLTITKANIPEKKENTIPTENKQPATFQSFLYSLYLCSATVVQHTSTVVGWSRAQLLNSEWQRYARNEKNSLRSNI